MDSTQNADIGSAHQQTDDKSIPIDSRDLETLIHIIKLTEHEETLFHITDSSVDDENDEMESTGDVETLNQILELIKDPKYLQLVTSSRTLSQGELDAALISACRRGYTFLIREITQLGADVQTRDEQGNTPLLICAENNFTNIARSLVTKDVNVNTTNNFGDTALIIAAGRAGSLEMVFLLLQQAKISVNHQNKEGSTALMKAVEAKNIDVIKLLLDSQENKTEGLDGIKNSRSETAQSIADKLGIGTSVKFLIRYTANVFNPLLAPVLTCDLASFDILIFCHIYDPPFKEHIIQDSFNAIFMKHEMSGEKFSENEEKIIYRLLQEGAHVRHCPYSFHPLLVATKVGSCSVLEMLMNFGANFCKLSDWRQVGLLATSAERGHADIIEILLKHNRSLAARSFTTPALISAIINRQLSCIEMLTKYGASLDIKFAFEAAVKDNDSVRLRYLIENYKVGISRVVSSSAMNNYVVSAARAGHIDILGILLDAGADVNCVNNAVKTPLMEAKNAEVVNFLVERGAVVNGNLTERNQIYSPLRYVLSSYNYKIADKLQIVEALLKHGAAVNGGSDSGSLLMIAVSSRGAKDIVPLLLDHGADANVRDGQGNTLLMIAAKNNFTDNIEGLLRHSKVRNMINEKNHEGLTALMISVSYGNLSAIKALINNGADVNEKNMVGNTALMIAISSRVKEPGVFTTLIQAGSDINWQNDRGQSALMLAVCSSWNTLILLVNSGANVNAVNKSSETALSLLMDQFHPRLSCVQYLLDHGASASYVEAELIIVMILHRREKLIPNLMRCGLGVAEISIPDIFPGSEMSVSPLCAALMTGNVKLASYFVENLFVTKSDVFRLVHNKDVRQHLQRHNLQECLNLLDKQRAQPLSLFSLAYLEVQSAIDASPGREERVAALPLPKVIKDRLMYKVETVPLDTSTDPAELMVHDDIILELETNSTLRSFGFDFNCACLDESCFSEDDESCFS